MRIDPALKTLEALVAAARKGTSHSRV